jgi:anthranilate synthase component I
VSRVGRLPRAASWWRIWRPHCPLTSRSVEGITPSCSNRWKGPKTPRGTGESSRGVSHVPRHWAGRSFIGTEPDEVIRVGDGFEVTGDPLIVLEERLKRVKLLEAKGVPLPPFRGGAVGYISYDAVRHFEKRTAKAITAQKDPLGLPEAVFMLVSSMLVFDRASHTIKVVAHCRIPKDGSPLSGAYDAAVARLEELISRLLAPMPATAPRAMVLPPRVAPTFPGSSGGASSSGAARDTAASALSSSINYSEWDKRSNMGKDGFEAVVRSLKEHVVGGDIIQAVPSQRIRHTLPPAVTPVDLYRRLRCTNPSPYMFLLEMGDSMGDGPGTAVVGASPEMLTKVTEDGRVETHPIAGTRRRGRTPEEDLEMERDLIEDPKERAEHIMLVDLGRNDCGRVCAPGSVRVEKLMAIERYSHVMHIVSVVTGTLAAGKTSLDAFRSIFPAGTVSGAPKIKAMELIAKMEPERRYIYAGAVGCWAYNGSMDTAIAIRCVRQACTLWLADCCFAQDNVHQSRRRIPAGGGWDRVRLGPSVRVRRDNQQACSISPSSRSCVLSR